MGFAHRLDKRLAAHEFRFRHPLRYLVRDEFLGTAQDFARNVGVLEKSAGKANDLLDVIARSGNAAEHRLRFGGKEEGAAQVSQGLPDAAVRALERAFDENARSQER